MIIYSETSSSFLRTDPLVLADVLEARIISAFGTETTEQEKRSWIGSVRQLQDVFRKGGLPMNAGIALEYNIPVTNNRIDCIVSGRDSSGTMQAVIIEMKGWETASRTDMPEIVKTLLGDGLKFTNHPSAQVKWYSDILHDYEKVVQDGELEVHPCAYLYNCISKDVIRDRFYEEVTAAAPPFCKDEEADLMRFIRERINSGDDCEAVRKLENSKIRASKRLLNAIASIRDGVEYFRLSPEQNLAYNQILRAVRYQEESGKGKIVLLLHGGPGTGKSVIAINAVFELLRRAREEDVDARVRYMTKTKPPRATLADAMLEAKSGQAAVRNTISYPNMSVFSQKMHVAVVDEAHRLVLNQYGDQLDLIIRHTDVSIFFLDSRQRITVSDIGTEEHIKDVARRYGATFRDLGALTSQFRSGITDWVCGMLQYRDVPRIPMPSREDYDFRVYDNPETMYAEIRKRDSEGRKAMVVAGYTREWKSRNRPNEIDWDLTGDGFPGFRYRWNKDSDENWATKQGIERIGCVHTCQGMEFDYVGVIVSRDIMCTADGVVEIHPEFHAGDDPAVPRRYCKRVEELGPDDAALVTELIRNAYYVMLSRGMKGCYVYIEDPGMRVYVKSLAGKERIY